MIVARPGDSEILGRPTAADFALESADDVERFLDELAR